MARLQAYFDAGFEAVWRVRTMGDYLEATKGEHRNSNLENRYKERAPKCLSHNNLAESPFAYATTDFSPFYYRPLGGKQLLKRMEFIGVLHLLPKKEKKKHSRNREKKGN
jgi:hypothetical protein